MKILRSRWFMFFFGIVVSVVCMWLAMRPILAEKDGLANLGEEFRTADYRLLPLILFLLYVFYWLKAWRWRLLLLPVQDFAPMRDLFGPTMIGFAFNNVLPARMGEFVRCFVFARQQKQPMTMAVSSIFLERVFDVVAIFVYLGIGLIFMPMPEETKRLAILFGAGIGAIALFGVVYVFWTRPLVNFVERILARMSFIPHGLRDKVCRMLENGADGMASIRRPRLLAAILLISMVKWVLNGAVMLISLWAFGIHPSPVVAFVLMGVVALGVSVPASPGYFGVIQGCFAAVLAGMNYDNDAVFAASVYFHLSGYIPVTILGLVLFNRTGLSLHDIGEAREETQQAGASSEIAVEGPPAT
ncbi:MAG: lysylphosphatidylglycerol synthase transmembrane domain-containing protein [Planctomycetaceae bacterium]